MGRALMLIIRQEHRDPPIEIDVGSWIYAMTFSANGEYLMSGDRGGVRVWRVKDGTQVARMEAKDVRCLAVSKDGRWIAAGTWVGDIFVWDAKTYKQVFKHWEDSRTNGVDFSPDSTHLVSASDNRTATVWDIPAGKRVQTLHHDGFLRTAKYSPQGDRIATATPDSIRTWDGEDGRFKLLLDIRVGVTPFYNTGLLWSNNHLFVISGSHIQQIDASIGSVVSQWSVPESHYYSCIALPKHGEFIAHSANRTVTFWDTSSHTQLGHIRHSQDIRSTALSANAKFIAIGEAGRKVCLSRMIVSVLFRSIVEHTSNSDPFTHRIQTLFLVHTQDSRSQSLKSMTPRSIHGGSINSQTRKYH